MNERIKDLIEQEMTKYYEGEYADSKTALWNLEEFAESIIRQCAELAEDYDGAHYIGTSIKEHFGVV